MGLLDKMMAAVTPLESDDTRMQIRAKARAVAPPDSWMSLVLDHHEAIEECFEDVCNASDNHSRQTSFMRLATLLNGHSLAEEVVLYPALALNGEKSDATEGYSEQAATKIQMAALEDMDPASQDYLDKIRHVRGAVLHHMYEEENEWFPELLGKCDVSKHHVLTMRYQEEFLRYTGDDELGQLDREAIVVGSGSQLHGLPVRDEATGLSPQS